MKRLLLLTTAMLVVAAPTSATAAGMRSTASAPTATLTLDSYAKWAEPFTHAVWSPFTVRRGVYYVATVSGTFSYYTSGNYHHPQRPWSIVCGTTEPKAWYTASLGGDGPVGFDAEFVFARPWTAEKCKKANLPVHWVNFQMDAGGTKWAHPAILGTRLSRPTSKHTYRYAVVGTGGKIGFRLADAYVRDNYGILKIALAPATTADCESYGAFGFSSMTACVARLGEI